MNRFFARLSGAAIVVAALAACSGNQALPPATSPQGAGPLVAPIMQSRSPQIVGVTAANIEFARSFQVGNPRPMFTRINNPFTRAQPPATAPVHYPMDMPCAPYGGTCTTMPSSKAYNIYVSPDGKHCTTEACWGNPEEFLKALAGSSFAGLITQYTHGKASGYTFGGSLAVRYSSLKYDHIFYQNDLATILAAAVAHFGAVGTTAEYHLFLPPGYDTCYDEYAACYSPDNLKAFAFCAYHNSEYVPSLKTNIIFSVQPWAGAQARYEGREVYLCGNSSPSLKPSLNNFTASVVGHESFESWSDPVVAPYPLGYFNTTYDEIGDICAYQYFNTLKSGSLSWNVQDIYSNAVHGCTSQ